MRIQRGNYFITITKLRHEIRVTTLWLKQPVCFYSVPVIDLHAAYGPNTTPALYVAGLGTQLSTVQYFSACKSDAQHAQ